MTTPKVNNLYLEVDTVPVTLTTKPDMTIAVQFGPNYTIEGAIALRLLISFLEAGLDQITVAPKAQT